MLRTSGSPSAGAATQNYMNQATEPNSGERPLKRFLVFMTEQSANFDAWEFSSVRYVHVLAEDSPEAMELAKVQEFREEGYAPVSAYSVDELKEFAAQLEAAPLSAENPLIVDP